MLENLISIAAIIIHLTDPSPSISFTTLARTSSGSTATPAPDAANVAW